MDGVWVWYWCIKCFVRNCNNSIVTAAFAFGVGSLVLGSRWEMAWFMVGWLYISGL